MGATFSINNGTNIESVSYLLGTKYNGSQYSLDYLLDNLKDNKSKLISESDVRDSVFSLASSFIFKETSATGSTISYIGFDTLNDSDRDLKDKKIFLGKRSYSGTYSYVPDHDIMSSTSSNHSGYLIDDMSDVDIFLYNTKYDYLSNKSTKIRILSGIDFTLFDKSPYIQSQVVDVNSSLSLDFVNPLGDVNIKSDYGTVSVNEISFPSISNSYASASNNKVLKWNNGDLYWDDITYPFTGYIGSTGSVNNIFGSNINVNGYTLELNDSRKVPISISDISIGSTFSNFPISE